MANMRQCSHCNSIVRKVRKAKTPTSNPHTIHNMNTHPNTHPIAGRQRGLTLIELVVVLAILVALVGLVVSLFPGLVARASRSTTASSIQDVARAVQINYTTTLSYGSGFDSLLNASGNQLYSGLTSFSTNQMARITLSGNDALALNAAGISNVFHLTQQFTPIPDATFSVTQVASPIAVAATAQIAVIDATQTALLQSIRGNYTPRGTAIYPVFGLNKHCSLVGPTAVMQDAPVRAGSLANENPASSYQRYGLVFMVDDSPTGTGRTARFLGAVAFTAGGIQTAEGNLQGYYTN